MSEIEERLDASEKFWDAADRLYWDIKGKFWETDKCEDQRAKRVTYEELRKAFLPSRTKETVRQACDKIAESAEELFANTEVFRGDEPSCKSLGLDKKSTREESVFNRCHFIKTKEVTGLPQPYLVCDCPDGYADYTPTEYAKEHAVKCLNNEDVWIHYSDNPENLAKAHKQYVTAREKNDVSSMVLGCDAMVNAIHGSGPLARVFVVGGQKTLYKLAEAKE